MTGSGASATALGTVASGTTSGGASPSGSGTSSRPAGSTTSPGQSPAISGTTCHNQATATGVTATTVKIGYINYDLANAGPLIGLPTPQQDQAQFKALIDYYNAHGGIQCRKIVASYYNDTLTDTTEHSDCLQAQQDGIFAMVFDFFTPQERPCLPAAGVPQFGISPAPRSIVQKYFPYDLSWREDENRLVRDYVFGSNKYGWFRGMGKLGVLDSTCYPEYSTELYNDLAIVGIPKSSISIYNYGCPTETATPDQNNEAVVQFKLAHVTNVMSVYYNGTPGFAQQAQGQSYQPKYDIMDDNTWSLIQDANPPDSTTLNGAFGITKIEDGAEHYSTYPWNTATAQCMSIDKASGVGSPTQIGVTAIYGAACASLQLLVDSANATVPLVRNGLARGMAALGALQLAYPAGPSVFNDPTNPTGDQYYRAGVYNSSCQCFKFVDGTFQPQFAANGQPQSGLSPIYVKP
ncbi:MAG TPA: hypothetical protein VKI19_07550 [Acidimicrobiales bacterium]|nr:hypothetical protein [Acidimicrobiales bacterium]